MSTVGLLFFGVLFAYLGFDAYQFERTSRHRIWAVPPNSGRAVGVDPLSLSEQAGAQSNEITAVGGIPSLFWLFVVLSMGSFAAALWSWL